MRNAGGHQCKAVKKKVNENTHDTNPSKKRVTKKFPEISHCSCEKWQQQRNAQKKFAACAKLHFC